MKQNKHLTGPDFVCIGAQKAGTTWLYDNLVLHPEIKMPPVKEIHFFDIICSNEKLLGQEANLAVHFKDRVKPLFRNPSIETLKWLYAFYHEQRTTSWYNRLFSRAAECKVQGDITPAYSTLDERGIRFALNVLSDDCKIFLIVRNPIDRIWSGVKMTYRWMDEDINNISINILKEHFDDPTNYLRTDYLRMIKAWKKHFGDRFKVFIYEDLVENPELFLKSVCNFIGVESAFKTKMLYRKSNADRKNIPMPASVQEYLIDYFSESMRGIGEFIPGIERRWGLK